MGQSQYFSCGKISPVIFPWYPGTENGLPEGKEKDGVVEAQIEDEGGWKRVEVTFWWVWGGQCGRENRQMTATSPHKALWCLPVFSLLLTETPILPPHLCFTNHSHHESPRHVMSNIPFPGPSAWAGLKWLGCTKWFKRGFGSVSWTWLKTEKNSSFHGLIP